LDKHFIGSKVLLVVNNISSDDRFYDSDMDSNFILKVNDREKGINLIWDSILNKMVNFVTPDAYNAIPSPTENSVRLDLEKHGRTKLWNYEYIMKEVILQ